MKTIKDVFTAYRQKLAALYDQNEIEAITLLVISDLCGFSKAKIKAFPETELPKSVSDKMDLTLTELAKGKPVQYILAKTEFYGLTFKVNPAVLIPRPETEELVDWVIASVTNHLSDAALGLKDPQGALNLLDIGTGSGCIAVSLKKNLPGFTVDALDVSAAALKTADENARLNDVAIDFFESDILQQGDEPGKRYAIIVSNPPYVTLHDKALMHSNVTDFEPHGALFVPEDDPLVFYRAIAEFALSSLDKNGMLFFEINESLGKETVQLLMAKGFSNIELRKDLSGRDRMVRAIK